MDSVKELGKPLKSFIVWVYSAKEAGFAVKWCADCSLLATCILLSLNT